jgi:DNA excision repair protein ERCC-6
LGPTLIVCPVTVIYQWVKHFHDWAPEFRVAILHQSGSYQGKKSSLIKEINKSKGILITSYVGILKYKDYLAQYDWHYLILDEGHKIRNPNAKVSIAVKKIKTPHRLMLTGSPMQNNLQELWSLFDFTNPGMLGNLNTFMEHFNNPIVQGGFVNATPMQEATALSVATTLKNLITPFLLRRSKDEVQNHISLPNKSEQVLFCSLTEEQRELYKGYLMSDHVGYILGKDSKKWFLENSVRSNVLIAITALRKICNHPDIYLHTAEEVDKVNEKTLIC